MKGSYLSERGIEAPRVEREGGRKKKCTGKSQFKASGHSRRHECPLSLDTLFGVYKDRQTGAYGEPGGWTWRRRDAERERERQRGESGMGSLSPAFSVQGSIYIFLFRDFFLLRFVAANNAQSVHCTDTPPYFPFLPSLGSMGGVKVCHIIYSSSSSFVIIISLLLLLPAELVQVAATM